MCSIMSASFRIYCLRKSFQKYHRLASEREIIAVDKAKQRAERVASYREQKAGFTA